jgi:hypothetical protein
VNARWLTAGLFLATLATLLLETLDARLLSALTWYHLGFLAVSLAMLGMAAGAVYVFLRAPDVASLPRWCHAFALAVPVSHLLNLAIPIPTLERLELMELLVLALSTVVLATPFFLSGVVVTLALTRTGGSIGRLYAADLLGASLGCLLVIPLLGLTNISSVAMAAGALAGAAAFCFARWSGAAPRGPAVTAAVLLAVAGLNALTDRGIGVVTSKGRNLKSQLDVAWSAWNTHSFVLITRPVEGDDTMVLLQ